MGGLGDRPGTRGFRNGESRTAGDRWAGPWTWDAPWLADGTGGDDRFAGTDGRDVHRGRNGDDRIAGGLEHDKLYGNEGNDRIAGGADDDLLDGGAGDDVLSGGAGDDTLRPGFGADVVHGGAGNDYVPASSDLDGNDRLYGDGGDDTLYGGEGELYGGAGDDELTASASLMNGGVGDDTLNILGAFWADNYPAEVWGGPGADTFAFNDAPLVWGSIELYDFSDEDVIDLSAIDAILGPGHGGNDAFRIVPERTGQGGELVITYDAATDRTAFQMWNSTGTLPDAVIWTPGDHSDFTNFVL